MGDRPTDAVLLCFQERAAPSEFLPAPGGGLWRAGGGEVSSPSTELGSSLKWDRHGESATLAPRRAMCWALDNKQGRSGP